ncbi:MAG: hypothetical protein ACFFBP_14665 [Promethearchaeota archaeon]
MKFKQLAFPLCTIYKCSIWLSLAKDWDDYEDDEYFDLKFDDDEWYEYGEYDESLDYDDSYDKYL